MQTVFPQCWQLFVQARRRTLTMPPKREQKKETESLTGVVVVDSYDPRFAPLSPTIGPWCGSRIYVYNSIGAKKREERD
ncbi:hypothetical protein RB195_004294 [Necator americanus]|uniref:Uncharacterized protein n=1 Tax=Necator americanus TaxID=51031 RepID=A0ABR1BJB5_NECAM